ncbi:MAG: hypothetical protein COB98_08105 [Flavobacteriaceae bacterium]|nr:MAG: hypothetical protein COB98_08105 [Flavobacteriaceae bacterium]
MKKIVNIALLMAMGLFLNSCYYDAFPEVEIPGPGIEVPVEDVSYATDIAPLWAKCIGCHTSSLGLNLKENAYTNLLKKVVVPQKSAESRLYTYFSGNGHLDAIGVTLKANQIALIKSWIDEGALNN